MVCKCYNSGTCLGTKEVDRCFCNGDESLCDFYPNVMKIARERREKEEEVKKQKNFEELNQTFQRLANLIRKLNNEVQSM